MNRKVLGTIIVSLLMICGTFLINTDRVEAAKTCTCYYYGQSDPVTMTSTGGAGSSTDMITGYLVSFKYGADQATVTYSCMFTKAVSSMMDDSISNNINTKKACKSGTTSTLERGDPFEVKSKNIYKKSCSEAACQSANIQICGYKDGYYRITTGSCSNSTKASLNSITKDQFNSVKGSDDAANAAGDAGLASDKEDRTKATEQIKNWATSNKSGSYSSENSGNCDLIDSKLIEFLHSFLVIIEVIGIVLLVILSAVEFIKAITASEEDGLKGAIKNTYRRIIAVVVLLLLPMLVTWVLNIVNDYNYSTDDRGERVIGDDGNPICKIGG